MTTPVPTFRYAVLWAVAGIVLLLVDDLGRLSPGWFSTRVGFVVLGAVLVAVGVADFLLAVGVGRIEVVRQFPSSVTLGHRATLGWRLTNHSRRTAHVAVADSLAPSLRFETRRFSATIPTGRAAEARTGAEPSRRGRFDLDTAAVRSFGPMGLMARQRTVKVHDTMRVLPNFFSAGDAALIQRRARSMLLGLRRSARRGDGTEFESLRELTPDDPTRRIDWAATARAGHPIVRTYRVEQNQQVVCLVDAGRVMAGRVSDVPRLEWAMDGAMMLAELSTAMHDRFGLVAFDRSPITSLAPSARPSQRAAVAESLFDLESAFVETDYGAMLRDAAARFSRRSLMVLLTELDTHTMMSYLVPALPYLVSKHLVVVAAVADPDVARWAAGDVDDTVEGLLVRATAEGEVHARARLAARLVGMGVTVIDAQPERFASELGEFYVAAKAGGRL